MTVDHDTTRESRSTGAIPGPRTEPARNGAWPGQQSGRRTRPATEYWDVHTARWVTRSPVPGQRRA
ncbi:hypothetical protein [Blastococcus brunescens]|uniref:Uncharacterized protein n=1 Tax=Blastococcus brunescens TaxID=1564165 RepID=A0ABZ1ATK1_9ACTN|nr:hypothetical protein [Blastococcus sp. BMG 8361]WRL61905.1 hypothetical protein U6N30_17550 [Blastococcus sp. BMG 8361]